MTLPLHHDSERRAMLATQARALTSGAERPLVTIAKDIRAHWAKPYFGAEPYLSAMEQLDSLDDNFGADNATSIVMYFLSNATTWRGDDARRVKAELKAMLASHARC